MMSEFRWRHWDVQFSCDFEKLREKLLILKKIIIKELTFALLQKNFINYREIMCSSALKKRRFRYVQRMPRTRFLKESSVILRISASIMTPIFMNILFTNERVFKRPLIFLPLKNLRTKKRERYGFVLLNLGMIKIGSCGKVMGRLPILLLISRIIKKNMIV